MKFWLYFLVLCFIAWTTTSDLWLIAWTVLFLHANLRRNRI